MSLIVQKFGGTSVKDISKIKRACLLIATEHKKGNQVVVIVSAMAGETTKLINLSKNFSYSNKKGGLVRNQLTKMAHNDTFKRKLEDL